MELKINQASFVRVDRARIAVMSEQDRISPLSHQSQQVVLDRRLTAGCPSLMQ
jgi:hypothetical protein